MPVPTRKKRVRTYVLPRKQCPMCGTTVSLTSSGKVPRHKDGTSPNWCCFQYLRPEQYNLLVSEKLLMPKQERVRDLIKRCLERAGLTVMDCGCPGCTAPKKEATDDNRCREVGTAATES